MLASGSAHRSGAYRNLSTRLRWLAHAAPFQFLWVDASGGVVAE